MGLLDAAFPDGRHWTRVGDHYEITRKPRGLRAADHETVPFVPMEAIPQGGHYEPRYYAKPGPQIASGTYFERGDLLIAKITPSFENGKQAWAKGLPTPFGYATTEAIPLHPSTPGNDRRLLFFYLLHPEIRSYVSERMEGSTGRQRVPEQVLMDLPYPELPPEEQRSIADMLERITLQIEIEERSAQTAEALKRAAMRELFTRGLRGEPQKETEIGLMPESWDITQFASVREWLQYGTSTHCTIEPKAYPVLRIPNVGVGCVDASDLKYCDMAQQEADKYRLQDGDLLFIRTNGVLERLGSCTVYAGDPERALFASYLIRARLKQGIDPRYVAYFYGSELGTSLIAGRATPAADGKYNLNTGTIDSLPFPLPPTAEEQREIVAILDAIDRKIELHRKKRAVLEELFKALLHKLMTGEIRLDQIELSALEQLKPTRAEARA